MTAANANYLVTDRQGSIVATAGSSGALAVNYTYDAYGAPNSWGSVGAVPRFRYTGQAAIPEAHLYHYKARVYDPVSGRFPQTYPVGYGPDVNWYAYVGDDPVNRSDPSGQAGCTPATGTHICSVATDTQTKALADVKTVRSGLKQLVTERAAVASGKQESLSASAQATQGALDKHFGTSSDGAISQVDAMLAGVERVLSDPGSHYNLQEANIGKGTLGRASVFGSTIKIGDAFLAAGARDREVTEIHESSHKVGANFGVPELYERNALRATIFPPYSLQNADNYGLFVYDSTH
jgi:RHS repeat-associated protein